MTEPLDTDLLSESTSTLSSVESISNHSILKVIDCSINDIKSLLKKYQLTLHLLKNDQAIFGSFWGDSEAGLITNKVYVREDTPIHSLLHESCHYICMDEKRRRNLDTNAEGGYDEENAVCYLQILLANDLSDMTSERMMQDMDSWGYTFRLGSAKAWFEGDAEDALAWLHDKQLLDSNERPNYNLRKA
ncbi:MAG: hypothetical protein V7749_12835 [Cocleimonas sp.]